VSEADQVACYAGLLMSSIYAGRLDNHVGLVNLAELQPNRLSTAGWTQPAVNRRKSESGANFNCFSSGISVHFR